MRKCVKIESFIGETITRIRVKKDKSLMTFHTASGKRFVMAYDEDNYPYVYLDGICGDLNNLLNSEVLAASEENIMSNDVEEENTHTWTFYKINTEKGKVTIQWYGSSNGYCSERVSIFKYMKEPKLK